MENELIRNIEKVHTTELGALRIKNNLSLDTDDVVAWCKSKISEEDATIERKGKNWYVTVPDAVITVRLLRKIEATKIEKLLKEH